MVETADSNGVKGHIQLIGYSLSMVIDPMMAHSDPSYPSSTRDRIAGAQESRSSGVRVTIPYSSMSLSLKELR